MSATSAPSVSNATEVLSAAALPPPSDQDIVDGLGGIPTLLEDLELEDGGTTSNVCRSEEIIDGSRIFCAEIACTKG